MPRAFSKSFRLREQYAEEALFSAAQAMAWAQKHKERTGRWPRRRYRLEGTSAGNSRLMVYRSAESARLRYGGTVVEMFKSMADLRRERRSASAEREPRRKRTRVSWEEQSKGLPRCPVATCLASPSFICMTSQSAWRSPHAARIKLAQTREENE